MKLSVSPISFVFTYIQNQYPLPWAVPESAPMAMEIFIVLNMALWGVDVGIVDVVIVDVVIVDVGIVDVAMVKFSIIKRSQGGNG